MKGAPALMLVLVALSLTAFAGSAAANPPTTPNGWEGACNMNQAWPGLGRHNEHGVGVQPGRGMERAMTVDNPNGNAGMLGPRAHERRTLLTLTASLRRREPAR
jgi:hypothetical protein